MSDLKQTLPASTRALPFTNDPTTVQTITTTADVVFTLDPAGALDGTTVALAILQNHPVDFPAEFIELAGSRQPALGKMNYYLLTRTNGTYQFIRYQSIEDAVDNSDAAEVGKTQLSAGSADAATIALSWTAATGATQYVLKRYTTADYSDAPVTVYSGDALTFTDSSLSAGTHYYYKINPATAGSTGRAAYVDVTTANNAYVTIYEKVFDSTDNTGQGIGAEGNYVIVQDEGVSKIKLTGVNGKQQIAWYMGGNYNPNDTLRITITGVKLTNNTGFGIYLSGTGGIDFLASDIQNGVIVKDFVPLTNNGFCYLEVANGDNTELLMRSIKIEKLAPAVSKLSGTPFGTPNYLGASASTTYDKMFDGDLNSFFDAEDGSTGYAGLDLGSAKTVTKIKVAPRSGLEGRSQGITLQGSNISSSNGYTNLFTIPDVLPANVLTEYQVNNTTAYRYYRALTSAGGYCNLSELELYASN